MKTTSTKRAFLLSVCSILLCLVMLVGTTFAWFTDTASTAVNTIQSGKLDVALEMFVNGEWVSAEGKTLEFIKAQGNDPILWEPGCEYKLPDLRIVNNGNLALKYKVTVNSVVGDSKLLEAIDFTVKIGNATPVALAGWDGVLLPSSDAGLVTDLDVGETKPITISGHMKEEAGNEYQNKTLTGLGITVVATQYTYEYDSFNNIYDENAAYPVLSNEELTNAITDNAHVVLAPGVYNLPTLSNSGVTIVGSGKNDSTLNAEKAKITTDNVTIKDVTIVGKAPAGNDGALAISGKGTLIENVEFKGQGFNGDTKGISVTGENTTIRNSKISGAFRGIIFWDNIGGDNLIENCTIDNVIYTFNINAGTVKPNTTLTVKGSTLNGWTSYSGCMAKVTFDGCDLGKSNGYAYLVAYADSDFIGCTFHDGYQVAVGNGSAGKTLTFDNCKLADGTVITAENFAEKLGDVDAVMKQCIVIVNGTTVNWD